MPPEQPRVVLSWAEDGWRWGWVGTEASIHKGHKSPSNICQIWAREGNGPRRKQEMRGRWRREGAGSARRTFFGLIAFCSLRHGNPSSLRVLKERSGRKWANGGSRALVSLTGQPGPVGRF